MRTKTIIAMLCIIGSALCAQPINSTPVPPPDLVQPTTAQRLYRMADEHESYAEIANNLAVIFPVVAYFFHDREKVYREFALRLRIEAAIAEGKDVRILREKLRDAKAAADESLIEGASR